MPPIFLPTLMTDARSPFVSRSRILARRGKKESLLRQK
jgi:hypothetical protein